MTGFYYYWIRLFRRLFGTKSEELNENWDISSDTMRIGSDLTDTDISSGSEWTRDSEIEVT
jgi:hypothetical protein